MCSHLSLNYLFLFTLHLWSTSRFRMPMWGERQRQQWRRWLGFLAFFNEKPSSIGCHRHCCLLVKELLIRRFCLCRAFAFLSFRSQPLRAHKGGGNKLRHHMSVSLSRSGRSQQAREKFPFKARKENWRKKIERSALTSNWVTLDLSVTLQHMLYWRRFAFSFVSPISCCTQSKMSSRNAVKMKIWFRGKGMRLRPEGKPLIMFPTPQHDWRSPPR